MTFFSLAPHGLFGTSWALGSAPLSSPVVAAWTFLLVPERAGGDAQILRTA